MQRLSLLILILFAGRLCALDFLPALGSQEIWTPERDSLDARWISLNGDWQWKVEGKAAGSCTVPACWKDQKNPVSLTHTFQLPEAGYQYRYSVWFGGVSHSARVMLNGQFLDSHEGASASFSIELPERLLHYGSGNQLEVLVDSRLSAKQTLPLKTQSWDPRNYGGIYREVFLLEESRLAVELLDWELARKDSRGRTDVLLNIQASNRELVRLEGDSLDTAEQFWIKATIRDEAGEELGSARKQLGLNKLETKRLELSLKLGKDLKLWSPQDPVLHHLSLELGQAEQIHHRLSRRVGLRRLGVEQGQLLVNGERLELRGVTYMAEHPDYGISLPPSLMEEDLERIRNLGLNTILHVRGAPHPLLLERCDQLGLFVITELPVWRIPPRLLSREALFQVASGQLQEFARRDRIHASLLALSLGSGLDFSDERTLEFLGAMSQPELDSSGLLLSAGGFFAQAEDLDRPEVLGNLDLLLLEPLGGPEHHDLPKSEGVRLLSRVGWPVEIGNQAGYEHPYSELAQAHKLQQFLQSYLAQHKAGELEGFLLHSYADWEGGRPLLASPPGQNRYICAQGLFSRERVARSAAKELTAFNSGDAASTLARGEYQPTHPPAYPLTGFGLLILLLIGYKQNNVFSQNLRRSFVHSHGFFVDIRDKRIYQFGQALFIWVLASGALTLLLSGWFHMLRKSPFFDRCLGLLLVINPAKEWVIELAWNPLVSMAEICLVIMGAFLLSAIGLRILGLLFNASFTFRQAMTFISWSAASLLFLIPLGIVFHPLLSGALTRSISLVLIILLLVWFLQRAFKAMRIAFGGSFWSMFFLVGILGAGLLILCFIWYENAHSVFEYLEYYRRIYWGA